MGCALIAEPWTFDRGDKNGRSRGVGLRRFCWIGSMSPHGLVLLFGISYWLCRACRTRIAGIAGRAKCSMFATRRTVRPGFASRRKVKRCMSRA
jgi:hypothetical protein